jgi:putative ABC transport system permease protein
MIGLIAPAMRYPAICSVLALRNLVHDRVRLAVTLVGVAFAVVLINVEVGIFLGFAKTTSGLIDHSGADLWIMPAGTRDVDQVGPMSERKLYQALAVPGVRKAARLNVEFADFKRPDGGVQSVLVVGFDPEVGLGAPWNVIEGDVRSLRFADAIMVDESYRDVLGVTHVGQIVEIGGHRAQVVGFTRGIRSFTQSPYVFASSKTALDYSRIRADQIKYVLVSLLPGANLEATRAALARDISDVDVRTAADFSRITQIYWMFSTGAGTALLLAAIMGLAVGAVVVSQTLYATTVDHLAEFGTLRAMGATKRYIYRVIIRQALLSAAFGYALGLFVSLLIVRFAGDAGPLILLPPWLAAGMFGLTVAMCVAAAVISIRKVMLLDPAMVFK